MPGDMERLVQLVPEFWNKADAQLAAQIYGQRVRRIDPSIPEPTSSVQQIVDYANQLHSGFPDFQIRITKSVSEHDRLVTEWTCSGTHQGEFLGVPATGKRVEVSGVSTSRIENGKVVEERAYYDRLGLLEQMGVVPGSAASGTRAAGMRG